MSVFYSWLQANWVPLFQTIGIVGGLWFTAASFRDDAKSKEVTNTLAIVERHRVLWSEFHQRADLKRILLTDVDLAKEPATVEETEFLYLIIIHFETGWRLVKTLDGEELRTLGNDAKDFFSRPLPKAVWDKTKQVRNRKFVRFVEKAISKS